MERVVVITGASGGLGQGVVREFAGKGWLVAAGYHAANRNKESEHFWPLRLDVTNEAEVERAVQQIMERWGRIDALINNAGVANDKACWQLTDEDWDKVLQVNLRGAFFCSRAVLGPMLRNRGGHIINISSYSGRHGHRGQANYSAAKAGLLGLTESLAREMGRKNIRVNAVLPGVLPTGMTAALGKEAIAQYAQANALGRINSIAEVARFIGFLAESENISGQVFQLDSRVGGWM